MTRKESGIHRKQGVERTGQREVSGIVLLAGSVLAAACIEKVLGVPLEKWRQTRLGGFEGVKLKK